MRLRADRLPLVALTAELVAAGLYLTLEARHLWFFGDDWSFLLGRQLSSNTIHNLFAPHNEHWSTVPVIIFRTLFGIFGVRHYLPYALTVIVAHLGICVLLWFLLRRMAINPWVAVGAVGVMAFLGAGAEDTLWDFQIGFVGTVFFGLLAALLVDRPGPFVRRDLWVWVVLVVGLMCAGTSLPITAAVVVFTAYRRGWRVAIWVASVPVVVYAIWFLSIGSKGVARDSTTGSQLTQLPSYIWTGLSAAWNGVSGLPTIGLALMLVLILALLRTDLSERAEQLAFSGLVGSVLLYAITGLARVRFGVVQADESRYTYIAAALSIPAIAWGVQRIGRGSLTRVLVAVVVFALVVVNGVYLTHQFGQQRQSLLADDEGIVVAAARLVQSAGPVLNSQPDPRYNPNISAAALARPSSRGAFPDITPTADETLDAAANLQIGVRAVAFKLPAPRSAQWHGVSGTLMATGCSTGTISAPGAVLLLAPASGGGMVQLTLATATLRLRLVRGDIESRPVSRLNPAPGRGVYVAWVAPTAQLAVDLPASGTVSVCLG